MRPLSWEAESRTLLALALVAAGVSVLAGTWPVSVAQRGLNAVLLPDSRPAPLQVAGRVEPAATHEPVAAAAPAPATPRPVRAPAPNADAVGDADVLARHKLIIPVAGIRPAQLRDTFQERRGLRRHEALDIMAPRGTAVLAAGDGRIARMGRDLMGGITLYQVDPEERFVYYYAHLDRYREGLKEGEAVKRGEVLGFVGSTGNAPATAPHLHFTIFKWTPDRRWAKGAAVNPYPFLVSAPSAPTG